MGRGGEEIWTQRNQILGPTLDQPWGSLPRGGNDLYISIMEIFPRPALPQKIERRDWEMGKPIDDELVLVGLVAGLLLCRERLRPFQTSCGGNPGLLSKGALADSAFLIPQLHSDITFLKKAITPEMSPENVMHERSCPLGRRRLCAK